MAEKNFLYFNICLFLGYFIYSVQSASFEFGDGEKTCVLLDIDASFDLSREEQKADPFTIDGANVTSGHSLCGKDMATAILSLKLFPSDEIFKINFRRESNTNTVSMSAVLNIDPTKHFENASEILPFELESSQDLPIGVTNMSYICNSEQQMFFNQDPPYKMTMTITNLHVQAYDIENGAFSSALECEQDQFTTPPTTSPPMEPTTEPETTTQETPVTLVPETTSKETPASIEPVITTTTSNDNSTSPEPETTTGTTSDNATSPEPETISPSNEPESTTSEMIETTTAKIIPKYEVKDGETVCIAVQGEIRFSISYENDDGKSADASIDVAKEKDVKVSGSCKYDGSNITQEFKLTFFEDKWSFTVLIEKDGENLLKRTESLLLDLQAEPSYFWKAVELQYVIDDHFDNPKASEIGLEKNFTKNDVDDFRANSKGSYKCSTGDTIQLDEGLNVDLQNFQYKAFNTDDSGDFTGNDVAACPADNPDDDSDDTTAIVLGAVFGGLAFILLVAAIVYFIRRNRYKNYEVM